MEFPNLGKQCSNIDCKQLDFTPLKCLCGKYLCKEHFMNHCTTGICDYYKSLKNEPNFTNSSPIHRCTFEGCDISSYIKMPCLKCSNHYCIEHRFHPECPEIDPELLKIEKLRWSQPKEEFERAKANVETQVNKNLKILQKSSTKPNTAHKIQLMKLKSNAKGEPNIPVTDRLYFAIIKPLNNEPKTIVPASQKNDETNLDIYNPTLSTPVFVSKTWSLGRAIDSIANICCIKNQNDKSNMPKLRIFRESDKMCLSLKGMDLKLSDILENEVIVNGEGLFLEYVSSIDLESSENCNVYFLK